MIELMMLMRPFRLFMEKEGELLEAYCTDVSVQPHLSRVFSYLDGQQPVDDSPQCFKEG